MKKYIYSQESPQVNKLTNLIGDFLEVTNIHSGRLQFHLELFDFNDVVNELVDEMQLTTEKHTFNKQLNTIYDEKCLLL